MEKILISEDPIRVSLAQSLLDEHGVNSFILNKKDSSYLNFGAVELYVSSEDFDQAREILVEGGFS